MFALGRINPLELSDGHLTQEETTPAGGDQIYMKYRPDVDGLRALAILPVILYHARLGCPGGFVGVDVFFVISGFVICSLLLRELGDGTFSLVNFWERRVRRILPALAVVVLATLIAAYFLFLPEDFAFVGRSVAALTVLGANFFFWKQSGYFAPGSDTKPLLHTWSLAVEEQFYLLFPLFLIFLVRRRKNAGFQGIAWLALLSFGLSVAGAYSASNQRTTFFLLPTRAWELLLGAGLAAGRDKLHAGAPVREVLGWLGLALIGWPVFCYSAATRFPGLAALPPCLGAALIIFSSETKLSSAGRMLAWRPMVFVGLISYSLYLWHLPLLTFATYLSKTEPGAEVRTGLLAASLLLAVLSWQLVEKPFRQRRIGPQRSHIFGFAGAAAGLFLLLGLAVSGQQGFPARFPATVMAYAEARNHTPYLLTAADMEKPWAGRLARFSPAQTNQRVDVVVWGDSHAMALIPVINTLCQKQAWRDMEATGSGTPPVVGNYRVKGGMERPSVLGAAVFRYITQSRPREVVLAAYWSRYTASEAFKSNLLATVHGMLNLGVRV